MASASCNSVLLLTTLVAVLVSCDGRPNSPEFTSYFSSPTTLRVEWSPGTDDGGGTVNGYRLHYRLGSKGKMTKLKVRAMPLTYEIEGLQACGNYFVRMGTSATTGLSRYSSFAAVERVASAPNNLNVVAQSGTSAMVNWTPPANSACISGYRLQYGRSENDLNTVTLAADVEQYIIANLQPGTSYLLTLAATSSSAIGEEAYSQWYQAPESVVPPIPRKIQSSQSDTEIDVTWQAPSDTSIPIQGYILEYGAGLPEYQERFPSTQTEFTITDLIPDTAYVLKLRAFNAAGEGEALYLEAATVPRIGPPIAPTNIRANPTSPESAIISWSPTSSGLSQYNYLYGPVGTPDNKLTQGNVGPSSMMIELVGLDPGIEYVIKVSSVNGVGESSPASLLWSQPGPPTQKTPEVPLPAAPGQVSVRSTSPQSAIVTWTRPEGNIHIAGYIVGFGLSGAPQGDLTLMSVASDELAYEIEGLKVGTKYKASVQAYNNDGDGLATMAQWLQEDVPMPLSLPTQPRGVLAYSSSPSSIDISWLLSEVTEPISGFQVSYGTSPTADQFIVEVEGNLDSVEIHDLKPDSLYYLKLSAFNEAGRSEAVTRSVQTLDLPPEVIPAPTNLQSTIIKPDTILISWTDESLGESQVVTDNRFYNVRYHMTSNERYLEERTIDTSQVIDNLQPGVPYEFTVQLIKDRQRSPVSKPIIATSRDPDYGGIPDRFTVLQVTVSSPTTAKAVVNWLPPPERGAPKNYIIEYTDAENFREPTTVWERMTVPGTHLSAVIDDLSSDQEYHARIRAQFSSSDMGPPMASPATFSTPVIPPSPNVGKQCDETEEQGVTRRVNFLWDGVVDGVQRPALYGIPIPYCDDEYSVEECHGIFCFCIPGKKPPALRQPECSANVPPCRREYTIARQALDEARQKGIPAMSAMLPHCRDDGYYHPKQCSGTMCYCVTENGALTGQERPVWEAGRLRC